MPKATGTWWEIHQRPARKQFIKVCVHTCLSVCLCLCLCVHVCLCLCICVCGPLFMSLSVCMCVCVFHVSLCVSVCMCLCVSLYVCFFSVSSQSGSILSLVYTSTPESWLPSLPIGPKDTEQTGGITICLLPAPSCHNWFRALT